MLATGEPSVVPSSAVGVGVVGAVRVGVAGADLWDSQLLELLELELAANAAEVRGVAEAEAANVAEIRAFLAAILALLSSMLAVKLSSLLTSNLLSSSSFSSASSSSSSSSTRSVSSPILLLLARSVGFGLSVGFGWGFFSTTDDVFVVLGLGKGEVFWQSSKIISLLFLLLSFNGLNFGRGDAVLEFPTKQFLWARFASFGGD